MILLATPVLVTFIILGVLLVVGIILLIFLEVSKNKKMYSNIRKLLNKFLGERHIAQTEVLEHKKKPYDFSFETKNYHYFIKVIKNFSNSEICVNSALKWAVRTDALDISNRMLDCVGPLISMDISLIGKKVKKIFIVYPNAHSLLKYINECEMVFVHPNTDVYGTNVMTYVSLKDDISLLD